MFNRKLKSRVTELEDRADRHLDVIVELSNDLDTLANALGLEFKNIQSKKKLVKKSKKK